MKKSEYRFEVPAVVYLAVVATGQKEARQKAMDVYGELSENGPASVVDLSELKTDAGKGAEAAFYTVDRVEGNRRYFKLVDQQETTE